MVYVPGLDAETTPPLTVQSAELEDHVQEPVTVEWLYSLPSW